MHTEPGARTTGWKLDLIIQKRRPFSEAEFARRARVDFSGVELDIASVEDVIISKLEWAKLGGVSTALEDVSALLRVNAATLDRAYLREWIDALGIRAEWERAAL